MRNKYTLEKALCTTAEVEREWNLTAGKSNNNVYRNYIRNPKKNKQYQIIDMGAFCVKNDITPDMLRVFVENEKRLLQVVLGNAKDVPKENNKMVMMTEKEYETFELFKKMQAFSMRSEEK